MIYLLLSGENDQRHCQAFNTKEEREAQTVKDIWGEEFEKLSADDKELAESELKELRNEGLLTFEGDPSIEWKDVNFPQYENLIQDNSFGAVLRRETDKAILTEMKNTYEKIKARTRVYKEGDYVKLKNFKNSIAKVLGENLGISTALDTFYDVEGADEPQRSDELIPANLTQEQVDAMDSIVNTVCDTSSDEAAYLLQELESQRHRGAI